MLDYLVHYGVKGMKWGKHLKDKTDEIANREKNLVDSHYTLMLAKAQHDAKSGYPSGTKSLYRFSANVDKMLKTASPKKRKQYEAIGNELARRALKNNSSLRKDINKLDSYKYGRLGKRETISQFAKANSNSDFQKKLK